LHPGHPYLGVTNPLWAQPNLAGVPLQGNFPYQSVNPTIPMQQSLTLPYIRGPSGQFQYVGGPSAPSQYMGGQIGQPHYMGKYFIIEIGHSIREGAHYNCDSESDTYRGENVTL